MMKEGVLKEEVDEKIIFCNDLESITGRSLSLNPKGAGGEFHHSYMSQDGR